MACPARKQAISDCRMKLMTMKCLIYCFAFLTSLFGVTAVPGQASLFQTDRADWWHEATIRPYVYTGSAAPLPAIRVKGNRFVSGHDHTLLFRGLSISDPDKIVKDGKWGKEHFEVIRSWGANIVRIPVHPVSLRQRGFPAYLGLLDQAVDWCTELGMYVIIDWHSIGNLCMEMFQADMYETSRRETLYFWKRVAGHFKGNTSVAFYEVFNEPTVFNGTLGTCTWPELKVIIEDIIDVIYAHDPDVIPLVGGFNWAYDLRDIAYHPVAREGVAYVTHPYPGKCEPPREPHWEAHFGFLADRYPIIATEMGYFFEGEHHLIDDGSYRDAIIQYLEQKGISWCIWVFDPDWVPQMIRNYDYEPTHQGTFFRSVMQGNYKSKN